MWSNIPGAECTTELCLKNKERIEFLLDPSVDPCEDFFQFACNSNKRGKEFPYSREDVSVDLPKLLKNASEDYNFLKRFFDSCLSVTEQSQFSNREVLTYCLQDEDCRDEELKKFGTIYLDFKNKIEKLANLGGWPVLTENWEELAKIFDFNWKGFVEKLLVYEYYLGALQYTKNDVENRTETETFISNVFFAPMIDHSFKDFGPPDKGTIHKVHIIPMTFPHFVKENDTEALVKYKSLMVSVMKILGANETTVENDMSRVIENEIRLAQYSEFEYNYEDYYYNETFEEISLKELNSLFENFDWVSFINNILNNPNVTVTESSIVIVPGKERIVNIFNEIESMSKREQSNLMMWRIISKFAANFLKTGMEKDNFPSGIFDTEGHNTSRSEICANQIQLFFPKIVDDLIVNTLLEPDEKEKIVRLFEDIKDEFESVVLNSKSYQKETKSKAIEKMRKMEISIGDLSNNLDYDEIYAKEIRSEDYLHNIQIIGNFFWKKRVLSLGQKKIVHTDQEEDNAFYLADFNRVFISVGITKGSGVGFSKNLPRALVYGGFVASTLGHELMHGFDNDLIAFDGDGNDITDLDQNITSWFDSVSEKEFEKNVKCMMDQYSQYEIDLNGTKYKTNGTATVSENICDNGGLKLGYR